ncbi:hypothetical protein HPP92_013374 [Vanilla planifolia]|uniref:Uncharacterized protein n=1 Tax=Vanilla planifolia TaxID=51239 RepID=A0A835QRJ9_VANPL|nr:hypothetical protein HPP92_013374 [Vanilla planifolia]
MEMRSNSELTIGSGASAGSQPDLPATACRRLSSPSSSPNAFLTPAFTAAAASGGSISGSPLNIHPSLPRSTRSRLSRLHFSSSSPPISPQTPTPLCCHCGPAGNVRHPQSSPFSVRPMGVYLISPVANRQPSGGTTVSYIFAGFLCVQDAGESGDGRGCAGDGCCERIGAWIYAWQIPPPPGTHLLFFFFFFVSLHPMSTASRLLF